MDDLNDEIAKAFSVLAIHVSDDLKLVSKAYRRLASQYHPDAVATLGLEAQATAKAKMVRINWAYEIIKKHHGHAAARPHSSVAESGTAPGPDLPPTRWIRFACPGCQRKLKVSISWLGKSGNCSACSTEFRIPDYHMVRCQDCGGKNRVPLRLGRKKAVCSHCFSTLINTGA